MNAWKDLVTAALLGGSHAAIPPLPAELETALPEEGRTLLGNAGALTLWRQAGGKSTEASAPTTEAGLETRPLLELRSRAHLRTMLAGEFAGVLPEWLSAVDAAGRRVPPAVLPELFRWAGRDRGHRTAVVAAGGERARWLQAQNAAWQTELPLRAEPTTPADDAFETGSLPERKAALEAQRQTDPTAARARLMKTWPSEPAVARTALLEALQIGLSSADEVFLESVLDDRSKEARRVAVDLLARLPDSRFAARQTARAEAALVWTAGGILSKATLELELPAAPDAAGKRDGLDQKIPNPQTGERAVFLLLMLSAVPLNHWVQRFGVPPREVLAAAARHTFSNALITGFTWAALRQNDGEWAQALLETPVSPLPFLTESRQLPMLLPVSMREEYLIRQISNGLSNSGDMPELLYVHAPWSRRLSLAVAEALRGHFRGREVRLAPHAEHLPTRDFRLAPYEMRSLELLLIHVPLGHVRDFCAALEGSGTPQSQVHEFLLFRLEALQALTLASPTP